VKNAWVLILALCPTLAIAESIHKNWENGAPAGDKAPAINFQLSAPHSAETYSCNLIATSKLCREYKINPKMQHKVKELQEGCESMGGAFKQDQCPEGKRVGACKDIVRNYHRHDLIYDSYYYRGAPNNWTADEVARVCDNLKE
jgi:hypothetical protein